MAVGDPRDEFRPRDSERDQNRREQDRLDEMRRNRERDEMNRREERETIQRLADVVNDQAIIVDKEMMKAINDPMMVMTSNGEVAKVTRRIPRTTRSGRDVIRSSGQFAMQGFDLPLGKKKRKGKKNPKLAAAFKEANRRYRLKNGKLRKGRTQADIARLAQRLRKKM